MILSPLPYRRSVRVHTEDYMHTTPLTLYRALVPSSPGELGKIEKKVHLRPNPIYSLNLSLHFLTSWVRSSSAINRVIIAVCLTFSEVALPAPVAPPCQQQPRESSPTTNPP